MAGDLQDCALVTSEDIAVLNIRLSSGRPSHQARDASWRRVTQWAGHVTAGNVDAARTDPQ